MSAQAADSLAALLRTQRPRVADVRVLLEQAKRAATENGEPTSLHLLEAPITVAGNPTTLLTIAAGISDAGTAVGCVRLLLASEVDPGLVPTCPSCRTANVAAAAALRRRRKANPPPPAPALRPGQDLFPLHAAAETGNLAVIEALLAAGACPHPQDAWDQTPLDIAEARCLSAAAQDVDRFHTVVQALRKVNEAIPERKETAPVRSHIDQPKHSTTTTPSEAAATTSSMARTHSPQQSIASLNQIGISHPMIPVATQSMAQTVDFTSVSITKSALTDRKTTGNTPETSTQQSVSAQPGVAATSTAASTSTSTLTETGAARRHIASPSVSSSSTLRLEEWEAAAAAERAANMTEKTTTVAAEKPHGSVIHSQQPGSSTALAITNISTSTTTTTPALLDSTVQSQPVTNRNAHAHIASVSNIAIPVPEQVTSITPSVISSVPSKNDNQGIHRTTSTNASTDIISNSQSVESSNTTTVVTTPLSTMSAEAVSNRRQERVHSSFSTTDASQQNGNHPTPNIAISQSNTNMNTNTKNHVNANEQRSVLATDTLIDDDEGSYGDDEDDGMTRTRSWRSTSTTAAAVGVWSTPQTGNTRGNNNVHENSRPSISHCDNDVVQAHHVVHPSDDGAATYTSGDSNRYRNNSTSRHRSINTTQTTLTITTAATTPATPLHTSSASGRISAVASVRRHARKPSCAVQSVSDSATQAAISRDDDLEPPTLGGMHSFFYSANSNTTRGRGNTTSTQQDVPSDTDVMSSSHDEGVYNSREVDNAQVSNRKVRSRISSSQLSNARESVGSHTFHSQQDDARSIAPQPEPRCPHCNSCSLSSTPAEPSSHRGAVRSGSTGSENGAQLRITTPRRAHSRLLPLKDTVANSAAWLQDTPLSDAAYLQSLTAASSGPTSNNGKGTQASSVTGVMTMRFKSNESTYSNSSASNICNTTTTSTSNTVEEDGQGGDNQNPVNGNGNNEESIPSGTNRLRARIWTRLLSVSSPSNGNMTLNSTKAVTTTSSSSSNSSHHSASGKFSTLNTPASVMNNGLPPLHTPRTVTPRPLQAVMLAHSPRIGLSDDSESVFGEPGTTPATTRRRTPSSSASSAMEQSMTHDIDNKLITGHPSPALTSIIGLASPSNSAHSPVPSRRSMVARNGLSQVTTTLPSPQPSQLAPPSAITTTTSIATRSTPGSPIVIRRPYTRGRSDSIALSDTQPSQSPTPHQLHSPTQSASAIPTKDGFVVEEMSKKPCDALQSDVCDGIPTPVCNVIDSFLDRDTYQRTLAAACASKGSPTPLGLKPAFSPRTGSPIVRSTSQPHTPRGVSKDSRSISGRSPLSSILTSSITGETNSSTYQVSTPTANEDATNTVDWASRSATPVRTRMSSSSNMVNESSNGGGSAVLSRRLRMLSNGVLGARNVSRSIVDHAVGANTPLLTNTMNEDTSTVNNPSEKLSLHALTQERQPEVTMDISTHEQRKSTRSNLSHYAVWTEENSDQCEAAKSNPTDVRLSSSSTTATTARANHPFNNSNRESATLTSVENVNDDEYKQTAKWWMVFMCC